MYLLPIYFRLSSFLFSSTLGRFLSGKGSIFFNVLSIFYSLIISLFILYEVCFLHGTCYINVFQWIHLSNVSINWSFLIDPLTAVMMFVILSVSFCANFYSIEYMIHDPHKIRFFTYLSLFTFTMITLVTSNNFVQLFFGWESVGITSYLLINFWYTRLQANKSSILAIMANKIGDILLLFTCLLSLNTYDSIYFNVIFSSAYNLFSSSLSDINNIDTLGYLVKSCSTLLHLTEKLNVLTINDFLYLRKILLIPLVMCLFIILASICKSAQAGFHFWLAEAMEGPTPVSSLLHAATMVTAGIFLTVRCSFLFSFSLDLPLLIILIGSITSFFSSLIGVSQYDIKKIVAYSTCSQLGYMFLSNGIFSYNFTMFHLFNHAFFKALLFLTSGYIIHFLSNEQDLRKMGSLLKSLPFPYIRLSIGSFSLMGLPYFPGFFSKDTIIENLYNITTNKNLYSYNILIFSQLLLSLSLLLTISYSLKILYYIFINTFNGYLKYIKNLHFSGYFMIIPLFFLSSLSIISGFIFHDMMIGFGSNFRDQSINLSLFYYDKYIPNNNINIFFILPYEFNYFVYYYVFYNSIYLITIIVFSYISYVTITYSSSLGTYRYYYYFFYNINRKLLFFNRLLINKLLFLFSHESYYKSYKLMDKNIFEIIGPFGIVYSIRNFITQFTLIQTGLLYHNLGFLLIFLSYSLYISILFI